MSQRIISKKTCLTSIDILHKTIKELELTHSFINEKDFIVGNLSFKYNKTHYIIEYNELSGKDNNLLEGINKMYLTMEGINKIESRRSHLAFAKETEENFLKAAKSMNYEVERRGFEGGEITLQLVKRKHL